MTPDAPLPLGVPPDGTPGPGLALLSQPAVRSGPPEASTSVRDRPRMLVVVRFRGAGWKRPLRPGDDLEVRLGMDTVGTIPADLVLDLLAHHVLGARLAERVQAALLAHADVLDGEVLASGPVPPPAPPPPEAPAPRLRGAAGRRLRRRTP